MKQKLLAIINAILKREPKVEIVETESNEIEFRPFPGEEFPIYDGVPRRFGDHTKSRKKGIPGFEPYIPMPGDVHGPCPPAR